VGCGEGQGAIQPTINQRVISDCERTGSSNQQRAVCVCSSVSEAATRQTDSSAREESGTVLLRSGDAALRLRTARRTALRGSTDGIVRAEERGDCTAEIVVEVDERLWSCAERNARNGAERRGTAPVERRGFSPEARRRTNQRDAPRSAEVKHRTVPVLSINTPTRITPLDLILVR